MLGLKSQISLTPLTNTTQKQNTILKKPNLHIQTHSFTNVTLKSSSIKVNASAKVNGDEEVPRVKVKVKWSELLLDPDRDNVVAVGLTGALVWAGVHVLCHLFLVIMAVLMAAIRYTFVGVLLIFIVITLL